MPLAQELLDEQVVCWNCEEVVHESAIQCPYCYVEVSKRAIERRLTSDAFQEEAEAVEGTGSGVFSFVFSLFFLLSGSAMFFLSVIIACFSKGGEFTLSWSEQSWTAFLGLGMTFLALGTIFLQNLPSASEEI